MWVIIAESPGQLRWRSRIIIVVDTLTFHFVLHPVTDEVRAIRPCVSSSVIFLQAVDQNASVGIPIRILNLRLTIEITVRVSPVTVVPSA